MKRFPKGFLLFFLLLGLMLLAGCQSVPPEESSSGDDTNVPEAAAPPSEDEPGENELTKVSGGDIPTQEEVSQPLSSEPIAIEETDPAPEPESEPASEPEPEPEPNPEQKQDPAPEPAEQNNTLYILMYHSIVPDGTACNNWTLPESRFREDLQWLSDNGYATVLPSELAAGQPLPEKAVMLTFDDGYENNYTYAFPLLQEFQAKAVVSLIVSWQDLQTPGALSWDMCGEMVRSGLVEIGSHTYNCHDGSNQGIRRLENETKEEYETRVLADIQTSIDLIETNLDTTVQFFAYPAGKTEKWAVDYLKEHFDLTVTTHYGSADISNGLYDMNRCNISLQEPPSFTLPKG